MPAWAPPFVAVLLTVAGVMGVIDDAQYVTALTTLGIGWAAKSPRDDRDAGS